jgi:hypothetical protein
VGEHKDRSAGLQILRSGIQELVFEKGSAGLLLIASGTAKRRRIDYKWKLFLEPVLLYQQFAVILPVVIQFHGVEINPFWQVLYLDDIFCFSQSQFQYAFTR